MVQHPYGWLSLLPPVVAIILAIATRRIVLSLVLGVFAGALLTTRGDVLLALHDTWEVHLWNTLIEPGKMRVFSFTLLMGAMIGVITQSGGMQGLILLVSPWARTRRRGQLATWLLGLMIFFDDYANTILLGSTLRPICDRLKISREKLAYLVDSTAAPVAGLALVSTWVAVEIEYIASGLEALKSTNGMNAFELFVASIPYRFYVWSALLLVPLTALLQRDFGPMLRAERDCLAGRSATGYDDLDDGTEISARPSGWYNAVVPIAVTLSVVVYFIYATGSEALRDGQAPTIAATSATETSGDGVSNEVKLRDIVGAADSSLALQYGALLGLFVAGALPWTVGRMSTTEFRRAAAGGARVVLPAIAILWCASTMSRMTTDRSVDGETSATPYAFQNHRLYTAAFLTQLLSGAAPAGENDAADAESGGGVVSTPGFAVEFLPTVVFVLSAMVAFCTGTSWGTMGILVPMIVPLAHALLVRGGEVMTPQDPILLSSIGGVLAGAVFGDHCSPISDTTVLSSQSSGCDHLAHVWTQMPYALAAAAVSILLGTLPIGFGVSLWLLWPLQFAALVGILYVFGRPVAAASAS